LGPGTAFGAGRSEKKEELYLCYLETLNWQALAGGEILGINNQNSGETNKRRKLQCKLYGDIY
jgi:hypothetical protein